MSLDVTIGDMAVRSAPIIGAAGADAVSRYLGLTLHEWFYVATIAYTFVQVWAVIYKTLKGGDNES